MKKRLFTITAFIITSMFWFFDSSVHYFIYKEPHFEIIPGEFNELWMRIVIVALIMFFGIFADYFTNKIMFKEKQLEVVGIYGSMMHVSSDILTNLLTQMKLFKVEAMKSKDFDRDIIDLYDNAIQQASELVDTFSNIHNMSEQHARYDRDKNTRST